MQVTLNMRQRRWVELLQEYDFDILYRPGKDNVVDDSLSRKSSLNAISVPDNPIISMVKESSIKDLDYQKLLTLVLAREATDAHALYAPPLIWNKLECRQKDQDKIDYVWSKYIVHWPIEGCKCVNQPK